MGMSGSGGRAVPFINVTPLIDVLLVVIIIFLVITPLKPRLRCLSLICMTNVLPIAVIEPAVADVFAVVHVGNHDVVDPAVGLPLRGFHRRAHSDDDQHDA